MVTWRDALLAECFKVLDSGGGKIEIVFSFRKPNRIVPIIHSYPDNQIVCEEVETEDD